MKLKDKLHMTVLDRTDQQQKTCNNKNAFFFSQTPTYEKKKITCEIDALLPSEHYCYTVCTNAPSPHQLLTPPPLSPRTGLPFVSQGAETQAVSAGNIFHSPGPTGALAATRYGSFQSFVLLGKYGSLWARPLCR